MNPPEARLFPTGRWDRLSVWLAVDVVLAAIIIAVVWFC